MARVQVSNRHIERVVEEDQKTFTLSLSKVEAEAVFRSLENFYRRVGPHTTIAWNVLQDLKKAGISRVIK
jgi:hypothetical protein